MPDDASITFYGADMPFPGIRFVGTLFHPRPQVPVQSNAGDALFETPRRPPAEGGETRGSQPADALRLSLALRVQTVVSGVSARCAPGAHGCVQSPNALLVSHTTSGEICAGSGAHLPRSICSAPESRAQRGLWLTSERPPGTCDPCCVARPGGGLAPGLGSALLFREGRHRAGGSDRP